MSQRHGVDHASTVPAEARVHQGHEAGIVSRMLAACLDLLLVVGVLVSSYVGWSAVLFVLETKSFAFPHPSALLLLVAYVVVATTSLAVPWCVDGRSFGQHVMGLRVTTLRGDLMSFPHATVHYDWSTWR